MKQKMGILPAGHVKMNGVEEKINTISSQVCLHFAATPYHTFLVKRLGTA